MARCDTRNVIDYVGDTRLQQDVLNAKVVRGMYGGSDHFTKVAKIRIEKLEFRVNRKKEKGRRN